MRETYTNKSCAKCGADLVCPECGTPSPSGTNFSNWIRAQPIKASVQDIDFVFHDYERGWFMTLEEKCYGAKPNKAQLDTHYMIYQMLKRSSGSNIKTMRGIRKSDYRGHHIISFEKTSPEDSEWISIDGKRYGKDRLFLLFKNGSVKLESVDS